MKVHAVAAENPFDAAHRSFDALVHRLQASETTVLNHSAVERLIEHDGREVLRLLFQAHLDVRGPGDVEDAVVGADEIVRERTRTSTRRLMSVFGLVLVTRLLYSAREGGAPALAPMDASLNLPRESYSHGVRRRVAELAGQGAYDRVTDEVRRTTGAVVPKRQAEELAVRAAVDFDDFYSERDQFDPSAAQGELLVITVDGKGIVMRPGSLTAQTQRAAAAEAHKLNRRLTKGEKKNRKRMATVAAVYTIDPDVRTPDMIIGGLRGAEKTRRKRPKPIGKRVWASVMKTPGAVIEQAFQEALHRDPQRAKRWVAVVDGNKTQLRLLREAAARHGVELTIVLDVIHVTEYLWKAARAFHAETDRAGEAWVDERLLRALQGTSSDVAAGTRRIATKRKLSASKRKPADKAAAYLLKYRDYLHYDEYLAAGLPIASGVIEGACRYLVKDRMDITGARWSLEGAEAVLKLRALAASGDFEAYWKFHEEREQSSNHDVHYAAFAPPQPRVPARRGRPQLRLIKS
jgi:hypothetical protein